MTEHNIGFVPHPKIAENYEFLLVNFMEWIGSHLADCSRVFAGDLSEMMVLAVIGQIFVRQYSVPAVRDYELDGNELTVSAARIAEITAMPRETVRRKLKSLEKKGWVEQVQGGKWKFVMDGEISVASKELMPLQMRSLTRMMNLVDRVSKVTNR